MLDSEPTSPRAQKKRSTVADRLRKLGRFARRDTEQSSSYLQIETVPPKDEQSGSEPEATARLIQNLIDSLPLPNSPSPSTDTTLHPSPYPFNIPLPAAIPPTPSQQPEPQLHDSRLVSLLSNASFMNGSSLKGKPSIWSILENIRRPSPNPNPTTPHISDIQTEQHPPSPSPNIYHTQIPNESSVFSDTSSIMVYSPLFPTQSDFVELAELAPFNNEGEPQSETEERTVVNSDLDGNVDLVGSGSKSDKQSGGEVQGGATPSWTLMWPFSLWYGQDQAQQSTSPQAETTDNLNTTTTSRPVQKTTSTWVPSSSKISVQAFWWGYRLYLPPPILEILSDKTLEATKRSAVITTALTWFFNNLPIELFPPPIKPALVLLQGLIPLLGYIGTFISWSWSTIRCYDVGFGVTLTATWILPVALIPGTWYERDFPKSPLPNSPIPLPRPLSFVSTPMSFDSSALPPTVVDDENRWFDPSLASPMTLWPSLASPTPTLRPIPTSPIRYPTTVPPTPMTNSSPSVYATPMSFNSLALPPTVDGANRWFDPSSLASSSTLRSALPSPTPTLRPIPTSPPNSPPSSLYLTPNSSTPVTPTTHRSVVSQLPTPTPPTPCIPSSPRNKNRTKSSVRSPSSSSSSPFIITNNSIQPLPTIHNSSQPQPHTTPIPIPIPIPPTPTELPPIPPEELPYSPKLVNLLLRGPVLQTVPLPDVGCG